MLSNLQKFLNFSEIKFVPTHETVLLGSPYSENIIADPSTCFITGNLL